MQFILTNSLLYLLSQLSAFPTQLIAIPTLNRQILPMKEPIQKVLRYVAFELGAYAVLAIAYFYLVLRFLGTWLAGLFHEQRIYYVIACVLLMVGQSIGLERLITALSYVIRSGKK